MSLRESFSNRSNLNLHLATCLFFLYLLFVFSLLNTNDYLQTTNLTDRLNDLIKQEIFKIEVLAWLKNKGFLCNMIFGGGTML